LSAPVRVRFAPSPTGKLHIGGARTALFNWAFARRHAGKFLLRIEDTDVERSTPEFERAILEGLRWLGIEWDEGPDVGGPCGPYRQSERMARYQERAQELLNSGWAYRCFCSAERLERLRAEQEARREKPAYDGHCRSLDAGVAAQQLAARIPWVIRFRVPPGETRFHDLIRGDVAFQNAEVDDWVMVRSSGAPIYNFVVVCDDIDMRISHVMRGEEHLTNTPKQVLLYRALAQAPPIFAHFPLMLGVDGKKLSKRTGDTALQDYRDKGYPPEAVLNFLCLQGWALDDKTEIFSIDELVRHFDPADVGKRGAIFDLEKFQWMAGEYIRRDSLERVAARCANFVVQSGLLSQRDLELRRDFYLAAVASEKERIRTYSELPARIGYLFQPDDQRMAWSDEALRNAKKHPDAARCLREYRQWLQARVERALDPAALREATKAWLAERGLKTPVLFQPLRAALTGENGGPDNFEIMALLGAERTLKRLESAETRLSA
jgi:glutamyl-tRNA synthetase